MDVSATGSFSDSPFGDEHSDSATDLFGDRTEMFQDERFGDANSVMDVLATYIPSWTVRRWTFRRRVFGDGHFGKNFEEK